MQLAVGETHTHTERGISKQRILQHVAFSHTGWPAAGGALIKSVTLKIEKKKKKKSGEFLCVCRDAYERGHLHTWR